MSQSGMNNTSAGPSPPAVPTQFTTDLLGPAIPVGNNVNVYGGISSIDNGNGIATTATGDTMVIELTNRINTTTQTNDASNHNVGVFVLSATSGTYLFEGEIQAYNKTSNLGASFKLKAAVRTTSGTATEISTEVEDVFTEGGMSACVVTAYVVAPNSFSIGVQGYGTEVINWRVFYQYSFVDGTA